MEITPVSIALKIMTLIFTSYATKLQKNEHETKTEVYFYLIETKAIEYET
ncbi:hypothetical protein K6T43_02790 [Riemerella anatipestifer]|nr:hypothetical protein [Riemerella anatipestifer]MBT0572428.1 hypothetical protein [Riemerella anatipestifer]QZO96811.1 hypothetical protein K6T43_02790 [Riemerella anatipestifer]